MGLILTSRRLLPAPVAAIELLLVERKQRKSSVFKRFRGETDAIGGLPPLYAELPLCLEGVSPHTGQSSQLVFDAITRSAQFLATLVGTDLNLGHSLQVASIGA